LDSNPSSNPSPTPPLNTPLREGLPGKIFFNEEGLRAGWRLLIYAGFWIVLEYMMHFVVWQFLMPSYDRFSPAGLFLDELLGFAAAFGGALLMAQLERRNPAEYGLPLQEAFGKRFWQGFLLGLVEVSALVGLIAAFGGYSFGKIQVHGADLLRWGGFWSITFVFVGLYEEFFFRGYSQFTLAKGIGFWPAAISFSLLFGAVHLKNPGEGMIGAASVAVTGLVFAFALRRTGNLWLAVGWHASFDFGETFLFSVPNSGVLYDHHLSGATLHGADWLTGGTIGPEGSVFSFLILGLSFLVIHLLFPAKPCKRQRIEETRRPQ
jgi:membrane protease YdiL (CAAX protease family)